MRVIKFGGTSVGTPESILRVKSIVCSRAEAPIVVVSAFSGVTDQLIRTANLAEKGDCAFREEISSLRERHLQACKELVDDSKKAEVEEEIVSMLERLSNICEGIFLLRVLPPKSLNEVVSFGERMSAKIISEVIPEAKLYDSMSFIRTTTHKGMSTVDLEKTFSLISEAFKDLGKTLAIVPGFIARESSTGEISNLGRGGSDYTASLIAAALNAELLEIWTDVDGFMTADPKIIKTSYVIDEMSYAEAMELCNFGAKVVYTPTLYPAYEKGIPILIKNTFNPDSPGTTIKRECSKDGKIVRGISSIDNISLITLSSLSMIGLVGIDSRIFSALAAENISAFLVSQSASETGISIGVSKDEAPLAAKTIEREFEREISSGAIMPIKIEEDLAAIAVVGENMKYHSGIAGKLFGALGRNGISILACAQGSSERNISFVIKSNNLVKSLNIIHETFFLSEHQELNLFICGIGTVGGKLIEQLAEQREALMKERKLKINITGLARSTRGIFSRDGIELQDYRSKLEEGMELTPQILEKEVIAMNIFNSVFVDCTASPEISALYENFLKAGVSVVTANKLAASSDYSVYKKLKEEALHRGVKFLFETNVGAGLPIINTINDLCKSGDKILKLEAVVSGTLNFIFNSLSPETPFSKAVRLAVEKGYAEPDPRVDLCGKDVIRKLVILSREAGYEVNVEDVEAKLFIPNELFECSMEDFWKKLPEQDAYFEQKRQELQEQKKRLRFVASMQGGKCSVGLREIDASHSFYVLDGSNNIVLLYSERYKEHPMLIQGYGAGADVTAAGVFADIMRIANI